MSVTWRGLAVLAATAGLLATGAAPAVAAVPTAASPLVKVIVRLQPRADVDTVVARSAKEGGRTMFRYRTAIRGFAVELPARAVAALQRYPEVVSVEPDLPVTTTDTQSGAPWGLDRIDQRALPLSGTYTYPSTGAGVTAYVIDSGVLGTHTDFGGRVRSGYTAFNDGRGTTDCNGHGTHVAGTVGGATYGVAKAASLVAVRVLDCSGSGATSGVIAGLDWAAADHAAGTPAVANLSLGGGTSTSLDAAIRALVDDGVTVAVSAGNDNADACTQSPARVPSALTVAASTRTDARASFSNLGPCVDLFAPGSAIVSDWYSSPTATNTLSGTSMASPHVAGAAAVLLGQQPGLTPAAVATRLLGSATSGVITGAGTGTPNKLLYVESAVAAPLAVTNPGARTGTVGTATSLTLGATDGAPPYTWSATGLPAGLAIGAATGTIAGTPTAAGSTSVTVTATDSAGLSASTTFSWTIAAAPVGCAGAGQKLVNPGFESGATGWTATAGVIGQPAGATAPRTGTWNARLGGKGRANTTSLAQSVAVPAGCASYKLTFWLKVDSTEGTARRYDTLTVSLGSTTLGTWSNQDKGTAYVQRTVDVAGQAGRTVTLTFSASEDYSLATTFAVDDTALTAT